MQNKHLDGLKAFAEEYKVKRKIIVSNGSYPKNKCEMEVILWKNFLEQLLGNDFI